MSISISFCNDCDLMTRNGFEEVHAFLKTLGWDVGDSFWLFDPSGGDMALFTHDVDHPGPHHAWLLDRINEGTLDVLHSAGSYGRKFNNGFRPSRGQIHRALEYLQKHAVVPRIWTNHGDDQNIQNVGGAQAAEYQLGDLPGSEAYCLDLLRDFGIEFYWLDRLLWRDSGLPMRLVAPEKCRDGSVIQTFCRYLAPEVHWSPNAQNFSLQLSGADLKKFIGNEQDVVFYTHWGCHHDGKNAISPKGAALTDESRVALQQYAQALRDAGARVVRLEQQLSASARRKDADELQRIGKAVVKADGSKTDQFYYNQYWKHGIQYFQDRVRGLPLRGGRALDAGSGVGQWSFALLDLFEEVHGVEINQDAARYTADIVKAARLQRSPTFRSASIEELPYPNSYFDFVFCYGVLFSTHIRQSIEEIHRVLKRGGEAFFSLNADGWYEYLCDERFHDADPKVAASTAEPIWNAFVTRVGGLANLRAICRKLLRSEDDAIWRDIPRLRSRFIEAFGFRSKEIKDLLEHYSDRMIGLLGENARRLATSTAQPRPSFRDWMRSLRDSPRRDGWGMATLPTRGVGSFNRALQPEEFKELCRHVGLRLLRFGPDGSLSGAPSVRPIYAADFRQRIAVWECLVAK